MDRSMTYLEFRKRLSIWSRLALPAAAALTLAACASVPNAPPLPQMDAAGEPITEADDVAIAGQLAAHSIMDLPEVAQAKNPPLVKFEQVTSTLPTPIDTEPYTDLLRDRLLLLAREKLRFVEHTLPPLHGKKFKVPSSAGADDEITAVLGQDAGPDTYLMRIQFVDLHSGQPIFSGIYRIRPEAEPAPEPAESPSAVPGVESTAPMPATYPTASPYATPATPVGPARAQPVTPVNLQ
jgi:hypothetical protein